MFYNTVLHSLDIIAMTKPISQICITRGTGGTQMQAVAVSIAVLLLSGLSWLALTPEAAVLHVQLYYY